MHMMKDNNWRKRILFLFLFIANFYGSNGCWMEGVEIWALQVGTSIQDVYRGDVFNRETRDIDGINSYTFLNTLNGGPYFTVTHSNNRFIIATNDEFDNYEENETLQQLSVTVTFSCSTGSTGILVFVIEVEDTNNNPPVFLPSNALTYTIYTPTPPGTIITGCFDGITVRDIDLTTQRIDFTIQENPYFEIEYDAESSTTAKEFIGIIKTTTFIRTLPEPITLTITATDVDLTDDPPRSTTATVTIVADTEFQLPEDPVFSQAFYLADYTDSNQLIVPEPITLESGFHELVQFSLQGEYRENFEVIAEGNQVSISVVTPLPEYVLREHQILLVLRADREFTSGDSATVVIQLPEEIPLAFESAVYEGRIENKILFAPQLTLTQGYEGESVRAEVYGDYSTFFTPNVQGNIVTLSMGTLTDDIINDNNVISLEVVAFTEFSSARSIVTLEIIKNDNVTPVFNKAVYSGSYDTDTGLTLEQIVLDQGYDDTVELSLEEDPDMLFTINQDGPIITLSTAGIPPAMFRQQQIVLTLVATKPRTVGATAVILINLPAEIPLEFESALYEGRIENKILFAPQLTLTQGYEGETVRAEVYGDYATFFTPNVQGNIVTLSMGTLTDDIINDNNVISLEVVAFTEFSSARSIVTLEIIKNDNVTPVFNKAVYSGSYDTDTGLTLEQIVLDQGYDDTVELSLEEDPDMLFTINQDGPITTLSTAGIPPAMFRQQQIVLTLVATKPRTVGATAAILITLPAEASLAFDRAHYEGRIENNILFAPQLTLTQGYDGETVRVEVFGDYATFFTPNVQGNIVTLSMGTLTDDIINDNNVISLEVVAFTEFSSARSIVTLEIIKNDNVTPVFNKAVYSGSYDTDTGLSLEQIVLDQGYDNTVELSLEQDPDSLFTINQDGPMITLSTAGIPPAMFSQQQIVLTLVATKPRTVGATAVIIITLPPDEQTGDAVSFDKLIYQGVIELGTVQHEPILITNYNGAEVQLGGEYAILFVARVADGAVTVQPTGTLNLPSGVTQVALELHTAGARAVLLLDIAQSDEQTGEEVSFEKLIYEGVIELGTVQHEPILITNYNEAEVQLVGEYALLFVARVADGAVTVQPSGTLNLPYGVTQVALELHAAGARAVLILNVVQPDEQTGDEVSFDKLIYQGVIELGTVQHEPILITNYNGAEVQLGGEYAILFVARVADGAVTVQPTGTLNLPSGVTQVALELHTAGARAVLLLDVAQSDEQTGEEVSFEKLIYEGVIELGTVQHEPILVTNYNEAEVQLVGEYALLFVARVADGAVTVQPSGTLNLPYGVTQVALELHAAGARAVLILNVVQPDEQNGDEVSFDKLIYQGVIELGTVQHEPILVINYNGAEVLLGGEYAILFVARVANGAVTVQPTGTLNLPSGVTQVALELHTAGARAVLLLDVAQSDEQTEEEVSFEKLIYEGVIELGTVQHEPILVTNYNEAEVQLVGEYALLFVARVADGAVTVQPSGTLNLPYGVTQVALELHAAGARAVLILNVVQPDEQTGDEVSFDKLIYQGVIELGTVQHEPILITNYNGAEVQLGGEYAILFVARVADGAVTVQPTGTLNLPSGVTQVALELHTAGARAVLLLDVAQSDEQTEEEVSFEKLIYEGVIELGTVQHEPILVTNYNEAEVQLVGEYALLFVARVADGAVTVQPSGTLNLPYGVTQVALELHAAGARAVLILNVVQPDEQTGDEVSFDKLIYQGVIEIGTVQHEPILITNYNGAEVQLGGEYAILFVARVADGAVTVQPTGTLNLPSGVTQVALELHTAGARAVLLLDVAQSDEQTEEEVSFEKLIYEGVIELGTVQHEPILVTNYNEAEVQLVGEYALLFVARVADGAVTVQPSGTLNLPYGVTQVALELHAAGARAVLILNVVQPDEQTGDEVSFDKLIYQGVIELGTVQHEPILITNYNGAEVQLGGEYAILFVARVADGAVTVQPTGTLNLPSGVTQVALELHTAGARAVLLLDVAQSDEQTEEEVSFEKLIYEGVIELGTVQHEPILVTNYNEAEVQLVGEYALLFVARVADGAVTVQPSGTLNLPYGVTQVALELHAAGARAVLILNVVQPDEQTGDEVSFDKLIYQGVIEIGTVQHEPILITNYNGAEVQLGGEYAILFVARVADGAVTVQPTGTLNLPSGVTQVALELHTAGARAVLLLDVAQSDEQTEEEVSFEKLIYEGVIELGTVQHEPILVTNYNEAEVQLVGEYALLFVARVADGAVTVQPSGTLNLPYGVTQVALELHAAGARAVLILNVVQPDEQTGDEVSFDKLIYQGVIELGTVQHEPILITNYNGAEVQLGGEYAILFVARVADGAVTVQPTGTLNLPSGVTQVALELHTAGARAVLLLDVAQSDEQTEEEVSFEKLIYEGVIELGTVQHEPILVTNYNEAEVQLVGEYALLFVARVADGAVTVQPSGTLNLPYGVTQVALELHAAGARAVLILNVVQPDEQTGDEVSFDKLIYQGVIEIGTVQHEPILITNYNGAEVQLGGEYAILFVARVADGAVTVQPTGTLNLPSGVTQVALELHTAGARAVLLLDVAQSDEQTEEEVSFEKLIYEGVIELGTVQHEPILVTNYNEAEVQLVGEYALLFVARVADGAVTVQPSGTLNLPYGVTQVALELHAAGARAVLILNVVQPDEQTGDEVSFDKLIYQGVIELGTVQHEPILITNYNGAEVQLGGEYAILFVARVADGAVTVQPTGTLNLPSGVTQVALELHTAGARAVLLLDVAQSDEQTEEEVSFEKLIYEGVIELGTVQHEPILVTNYNEAEVQLVGEYALLFVARVADGAVTVQPSGTLNLPYGVTQVALELHAAGARAVLILNVVQPDEQTGDEVSFDKLIYQGVIELGTVQHEPILITNYNGAEVQLGGEYAILFVARVADGAVTVQPTGTLNLPSGVTQVALELHTAGARAVLLLDVAQSDEQTEEEVSFEKLIYEGVIELGTVQHEPILVTNYNEAEVQLVGEYALLFVARVADGAVTVQPSGTLNLPYGVTQVALELHAAGARAVLILNVVQPDEQTGDEVSFDKLIYQGVIEIGTVQHEPILITNYNGAEVQLGGEYAILFVARVADGAVTVQPTGTLNLPSGVTQVALELHTAGARAVLLLDVAQSDEQTEEEVSFEKLIYEGVIELGTVQHEPILVTNYNEAEVQLVGEYALLFVARVADGAVTVQPSGTLNLPYGVTQVALELHAAGARAVLILNVVQPDEQTGDEVSFDKLIYQGVIELGTVQHEPILITNYNGAEVQLGGEYAILFVARVADGAVTVQPTGTLNLPSGVTQVALELHTAGARAVLLLDVAQSDEQTEEEVSFEKLIYEGVIELGTVQHEPILVTNYNEAEVQLVGEYALLFVARVADGAVTVQPSGTLNLPYGVTQVALELHAAGARAVLILNVVQPDEQTGDEVSFDKLIYQGVIELGTVQHEPILITNYNGAEVQLGGEYAILFVARVADGAVTVQPTGTLNLPSGVTQVALELHTAGARAVLLLDVAQSDEQTEEEVSFEKLIYEGVIELGTVQHEPILVTNYNEAEVQLVGEYALLFVARVADGAVTVQPSGTLNLPYGVTQVALELHAAGARAVLILNVVQPDEQTGDEVSFDKLIYQGVIEIGTVQHEPILITNYNGAEVQLGGEYAILFVARVADGAVTVQPTGTLNLPSGVTQVALELHTAGARAVLLLDVAQSDEQTEEEVSFEKLIYEGVIELGTVQHEPILVTNYNEAEVQLVGEYALLFVARVADGAVTVQPSGTLNLPYGVTQVALELHAAGARAVLILNVVQPDEQTGDEVSFDKLIYQGVIELGTVQHEPILITNYNGAEVQLGGEYAILFVARVADGAVTVQPTGTLNLPSGVTQVALELHTAGARAVLLLDVAQSDEQTEEEVSFEKLIYEGVIELGTVQHEPILVTNYNEAEVQLVGEYALLFVARVADGAVTVQPSGTLNLPYGVTQVALELHAAGARAVLILNVVQPDEQTGDEVSFDKLIYQGVIELGTVQHEPILITNYNGAEVQLGGEYAILFVARVADGAVTVQPTGTLNLPSGVTQVALELHTAGARAVLLLDVAQSDEQTEEEVSFEKLIYEGVIELGTVQHEPILVTNYNEAEVQLVGEYALLFVARVADGAVTVQPSGTLNLPYGVTQVALELHAAGARAVLILNVVQPDEQTGDEVSFDKLIYQGVIEIGTVQHEPILITNYNGAEVQLGGEYAILFVARVADGAVTVQPTGTLNLPSGVTQVALELHTAGARAVLLLDVAQSDEQTEEEVSFEKLIYEGVIELGTVQHEPILVTNYNEAEVQLVGEYALLFVARVADGAVTVQPSGTLNLPYGVTQVALELHAAGARAVLILNVVQPDEQTGDEVSFDKLIYQGVIELGTVQHEPILITNYNGAEVQLGGEYAILFVARVADGAVTVQPTGTLNLPSGVTQVALELHTAGARAVLLLDVAQSDEQTEEEVSFEKLIYEGVIELGTVQHEPILVTNYNEAEVQLVGEYALLFVARVADGAVTVQPSGTLNLPYGVTQVALELHAAGARAVLILNVVQPDEQTGDEVSFDKLIYQGVIELGTVQHEPILITNYNGAEVQLGGEYAILFVARVADGAVTVQPTGTLNLPSGVTQVALELHTAGARAVLLLDVAQSEEQTGDDVSFDKLLYEGIIQLGTVQHESIIISNYNEPEVQLNGEYALLFVARVADGAVTVQPSGTLNLPYGVTQVALELHAAGARAVLILNVVQSDAPVLPSVTFSSPSYVLSVTVTQTGAVGRVLATADNGEAVVYSLSLTDAHLQARLSVNNDGELHLSAPANSGVYTFQVVATTVITQAEGFATVYLSVEAITVCGDDESVVVPPLIILDRDEEEPHNNLVVLNTAQFQGCSFTLTNRWPLDQDWLYVDETGLHARSIDREHEAIAFMALSQVQVELTLHCEGDNAVRSKRSLRTDWLGPYDYGTNNWILSESIPYNSRRSLVNLIVNDINDNAPIFVGKELEPIAVGYPVGEIEERILPRSLAELQATDADIGINAALRYWSPEEVLSVSPRAGYVHVRSGARLQNNQLLTVSATDQDGEGLTGDIQLIVKLLNLNNIAVVTVQGAFLDNEQTVLDQLSDAVGYEIRALRSVVISDDLDQDNQERSRKKRETNTAGSSLQLYVYGLVQREPVVVDRLTTDINNNAAVASVISTVSLEDHLVPVEIIISERSIGLLVATIVLSMLLFIIIVLIAIWFFLRWRKNRNYDEFNDESSLASRGSIEELPKPDSSKPRLNIEELRRSERRLQDMLNSPIEEVTVDPIRATAPQESIVDLTPPDPSSRIVIQSIDKLKDSEDTDDEFGETKEPRRKSVVTFNENVEKIIHVEDDADSISTQSGYEVFRL